MIEITKTKKLNSTTKVTGTIVQMSDGEWYCVTLFRPARNPWFLRGSKSTTTGRVSDVDIFLKKYINQPDIQEGIDMLLGVLNGETPILDKMAF